jgi:hypothetical protein
MKETLATWVKTQFKRTDPRPKFVGGLKIRLKTRARAHIHLSTPNPGLNPGFGVLSFGLRFISHSEGGGVLFPCTTISSKRIDYSVHCLFLYRVLVLRVVTGLVRSSAPSVRTTCWASPAYPPVPPATTPLLSAPPGRRLGGGWADAGSAGNAAQHARQETLGII